jgi:acyl transferase domain-containing protein
VCGTRVDLLLLDAELTASGVPPALLRRSDYVRAAGVLDEVDRFDAGFFGYTPREAQLLDPQQRLFLERSWEALERAGHDPARASALIGVFAGMGASSYLFTLLTHPSCGGRPRQTRPCSRRTSSPPAWRTS